MILNPYRFGGAAVDPYWANVAALLHCNGPNGSPTFTDETGKTWTAHGTAVIYTAQSKFGGASGDLRTTGAYITTASHADFGFGSGDFTIEGWNHYTSLTGGNRCLFDNRSGANTGIALYIGGAADGFLRAFSNAAQIASSTPTGFALNTWEHWAVTRQGTTLRGFINGVQVFSVTDSRTYASSAAPFIGDNYLAISQPALSSVDDFRITKGVARYTANFTPPTAAFPNS